MRFPISPFRVLISLVWQEPCYSSTSVDPERNVKLLAPAYRRQGQGGGFRVM
jgi:hypothetical protein